MAGILKLCGIYHGGKDGTQFKKNIFDFLAFDFKERSGGTVCYHTYQPLGSTKKLYFLRVGKELDDTETTPQIQYLNGVEPRNREA